MDELSAKDRREALTFADRIAEMAASAPDEVTKRELYRAVNSCRRRFGFSDSEKLEAVIDAIELGAATISDLVRETGFTPQQVDWATKLLEQHKFIEFYKMSLTGGNGRPCLLIRLLSAAESAPVPRAKRKK